jgi:hypothetical protein
MPLRAIALFFKPQKMTNEVVQVGLEKMMIFFGTIISFLLSVIAFCLIRYINSNDEQMKEMRNITADHETRITVLEAE